MSLHELVEQFLEDKRRTLMDLEQNPINLPTITVYRNGRIDEIQADIDRLKLILEMAGD